MQTGLYCKPILCVNMIENSMFEEEPDVVDLALPVLDPDEMSYEPRSSRLLVRGLGENELEDDEEDYESSARLLGMSFMNRSAAQRAGSSPYIRQPSPRSCLRPSARTMVVCVLFLVILASMTMVFYFLPGCTYTKAGCPKSNGTTPVEPLYPNSTSGELFPWAQLRLPQSIHPIDYDITLNPNLDEMTFTGQSIITMSVHHNTRRLVLHGANFNITNATFKVGPSKLKLLSLDTWAMNVLEYKPWQQIAIKLPEELKAGQRCVLTLDYSASLSNTYDGFYNSSYTNKDGTKSVLAATQFEPLSARKAFPCFDEPAFKATFHMKISRKPEYMTLSNMPKAKSTHLSNGRVLDEFEKTSVNMSTYLVAFIVANFTPVSTNVSDTLVSVYSVPEKKEHTVYALEMASKLLEFYNNFFDIKYPLKKLDLIAIPDFLAGAMENWGLITFRETTLLVGQESSPLEKQVVASVIAHELAHQWFGNLVTMNWWNDLWLNEGFATYMQYTSLQAVLPHLDIVNQLLDKDALNSSHAVSTQVETAEQVEEMFDAVSYEKGASILLMLNASMSGSNQFRKGIIQYLKQFRGRNTDTNDLWNSLTQVELSTQQQNVSEMMNSWTSQKGFPLITVIHLPFTIDTQRHTPYLCVCVCVLLSLWNVPVTFVNDSCKTLKLPGKVKWLKMNYRNTGFYIVHYGDVGWAALTEALSTNVSILTQEDRASLIHNMFALSRLGRVSFQQVLNLLSYVSQETETSPVMEALFQLNTIYRLLDKRQESGLAARMKTYILARFGSLMNNQTWEKDEQDGVSELELRASLLETACMLEQENCTQAASALFKQYVESNGTSRCVNPHIGHIGERFRASDEDWLTLLNMYHYATYDAEKKKLLLGLASTQDTRKIVWILQAGLRGEVVQTQELPLIIRVMCRGFAGHLFVWDFIQVNWERLIEKFPVGSFAIQSIIKSVTSQFSTQAHLDQVEAFFSGLKERGSQMRSVQEALETIRLNQRWMDVNLPTLQRWL
uniref:Leucyl-cystinyl aminopeptidase-like n=1 Tax=Gouania willdenowi TaxID=441366 RepID=A0A8C5DCY5_GOUWI